MYAVRYFLACCFVTASFLAASPASAYLQFTYTSPEMSVTSALYIGEPWEHPDDWDVDPLSFTVSFKVEEQDLSLKPVTHFFIKEFDFLINGYSQILDYPMRVSPASSGRVSLNRMGEIVGWNFVITVLELITPDTDMGKFYAANHWETFASGGGVNTCDCDAFTNRFNNYTWHHVWIKLNPIQLQYSSANNVESWIMEKISVSEPAPASLLLIGISVLVYFRRLRSRYNTETER